MAAAYRTVSLAQLAPWLEREYGEALKRIDWGPAFEVIGLILVQATDQNFAQSKSPDGIPWAPLKRPRRRTRYMGQANPAKGDGYTSGGGGWSPDKPLRDTGLLMAAVASRNHPDHIENVTGTLFEYGARTDYGSFHQYGTRRIPIREFLGLNDQILSDVDELLADEASRQLGGPPGA